MVGVTVQFLGSGDAFGSGGRLQSCILIKANKQLILMDCGASSMTALAKYQVNPSDIGLILVTNLHGDHFGGIPYFIVDAQLNRKRMNPLTIAGPPGIKEKFSQLMEAIFPGSSGMKPKFPLEIIELQAGIPWQCDSNMVMPFSVMHALGDPHLAVRITCGGTIIAYSGDTEWTENLVPLADGADLLIIESYFFDKKVKYHLDYQTIAANLELLKANNLVITHMSENMLSNLNNIKCDYAEDGKVFEL
jgi:ribonuclease BN (tRNA processing enzyme)